MTVLLDTNVFLMIVRDEKLPTPVERLIEDKSTEILISIVTPWKIAILDNESSGRRIRVKMPLRRVEEAIEAMGARLLPITMEPTEIVYRLPLHHHDPFDRMIIAQAFEEHCPLVSADQRFEQYKGEGLQVIWN